MVTALSITGKIWHLPSAETDMSAWIGGRLSALQTNGTQGWDDPSVFPDVEKAVSRVKRAIADSERIEIFGDYDCDGVTSTAQILRCLRRHGADPIVRLPHRLHDGYGLREKHIDECMSQGVTLLITVDTGIVAHDAVRKANGAGIDVIILDHHHVTNPPDAYAILHPSLSPHFPKPHPSAAGVAFLFVEAFEGAPWEGRDTDLTLALFGTVADLVPLAGYNRRLVQEGLRAAQRLPDGPLHHLVETVTKGKPLTSSDIAFRIAPRINAAGRMGDPMLALTALLDGGTPLRDLEAMNVLRQEETARCIDHALLHITADGDISYDMLPAFLAVADASYTPGIVGLIAGKLTERFGRPSMAVHRNGDICTASLRSPVCYNIVEGLERIAHLLTDFGGHAQAAGCSFPFAHFDAIRTLLDEDIRSRTDLSQLLPGLQIDAVIHASDINIRLALALADLEPFGQGNAEPLFLIRNATLENVRRVGAEGKHVSATVGRSKLIGFGLGSMERDTARHMDLVCRIGMDTWNGKMTPQLFLVDAKLC